MRGAPSMRASGRGGHVDTAIVFWILLVLAMVAVPNFYRLKTGRTVADVWRSLDPAWTAYLTRSAAIVVAGIVLVAVVGAAFGTRVATRRTRDVTHVRVGEPALGAAALMLFAFGAQSSWAAWGRGGWWWPVLAAGLLVGGLGLGLVAHRMRFVVGEGQVRLERSFFGGLGWVVESTANVAPGADVSIDTTASGGAFGQPRVEHHRLQVGGKNLYTTDVRERAEALRDALQDALAG